MLAGPAGDVPHGPSAPPHGPSAPPRETDAAVIRASRQEPERFAAIFDAYFADVHRYVERRLGRDAADDLAAETFLVAFRQRAEYDVDRPHARPWLYGIATNLVGRHRRREVARYRALARAAAGTAADAAGRTTEDDVADRLSALAAQPALVRALAGLGAGDRDVVLLLAVAQLDHDEVAEALGIPLGTVRSRLHRARRKLRSSLPDDLTPVQETRHG
jgi:RNA polymerase sigma-70 factor (ECF subfamily)